MKAKKISEIKGLISKAYAMLPTDFSLSEVRFAINQALNKITIFENKQIKRDAQTNQALEPKKPQIGILSFQDAKLSISLLDKMIEEEERKINVKQSEDNEQTFYG